MDSITEGSQSPVISAPDQNLEQQLLSLAERSGVDGHQLVSQLRSYFRSDVEQYALQWMGKKAAKQCALSSTRAKLEADHQASINWPTTQNVFVEGDNLEALKLLKKSYHQAVKMIYIDPPYNTGQEFTYQDKFSENLRDYLAHTNQVSRQGEWLTSEIEASGRYHSNWLSMIYPRLEVAKHLLRLDGVILVHIDENESHHLRLVMNEIYGEENFLGEICWDKGNPKGDAIAIAYQHESILVYARDISIFKQQCRLVKPKDNAEKMLNKARQLCGKIGKQIIPPDLKQANSKYALDLNLEDYRQTYELGHARADFRQWVRAQSYLSGGEAAYNKLDKEGEVYRTVSMAWPNKKQAPDNYFIPLIHPKTNKPCPVPARGWRNPPETMAKLLAQGKIVFGEDESRQPERKYLLKDNMYENVPSILKYAGSDDRLLKSLGIQFDNPKPVELVHKLISYFTQPNDMVLDFFAGSGTTGHAVLKFDALQARHFILVQRAETTANGEVISNITKQRLYQSENIQQQGVKVFKLVGNRDGLS